MNDHLILASILTLAILTGLPNTSFAQNGNPLINPGQGSRDSESSQNPGNAGAPSVNHGTLPVVDPVILPKPRSTTVEPIRPEPTPQAVAPARRARN